MNNQYNQSEIDEVLSKHPLSKDNEKAVEKLLENFPEFKDSEFYGQTDEKLPYLVLIDFCNYLKKLIHDESIDGFRSFMERTGKFITDLYESGSKDLKELVRVGIFEDLGNDPKSEVLAEFLPENIAEDFRCNRQNSI